MPDVCAAGVPAHLADTPNIEATAPWRGLMLAVPLSLIAASWLAMVLMHRGADLASGQVGWPELADTDPLTRALRLSLCSSQPGAGPWWLRWAASSAMWAAMSVAMMLPCALPGWNALLRRADWRDGYGFMAGYALAWLPLVVGAGGLEALAPLGIGDGVGGWMLAGALALAGAYQFSPLKAAALAALHASCADGKGTAPNSLRRGLGHGGNCLVVNAPLMGLMAIAGSMNVPVMLALTGMMLAERMRPGFRTARLLGFTLMSLALIVLALAGFGGHGLLADGFSVPA